MKPLHERGISEIRDALKTGEVTAISVTHHFLERIRRLNPDLNVYTSLSETSLDEAAAVDAGLRRGETPGPLAGVPIAIKDLLAVRGQPLTCGSRMLKDYVSPFDATVIERLRNAGAVLIGKTNLDEFAMGSSTENSYFGPTRNPWDTTRAPGGSSGGSAVAVSAGLATASLGTDTGGSIRQPASFCSVLGLKPSYGRVSRYGMVAFGSSLDQIGPFTRSARDMAILMNVLSGFDPRDSTSSPNQPPEYPSFLDGKIEGLRLGIPEEYMGEGIAPEVRLIIEEAINVYRQLGARVVPVSLPHTRYAIPVYYILATSEASSNLARFDGVGYGHRAAGVDSLEQVFKKSRMEGFGDEVKRRIMLGTYCLSSGYYDAFYEKALRVRTLIRQDFENAFRSVDLIVGPTSPILPFRLGEKIDDPLAMYLSDILTAPLNLAGLPGLSLPAGFVAENGRRLPVGLQLIAPAFEEGRLLRAADAFESNTPFSREVPHS